MQARRVVLCTLVVLCLLLPMLVVGEDSYAAAPAANGATASAPDPLLQLLVSKGVLNPEEAKSLVGTPAQQRAHLLELLREKGVLTQLEYEALTPPASAQVAPNLVASTIPVLPAAVSNPAPEPQPTKPAAPKVIPAVAPLRVLQLEPSKPDGMIPDIKLGSGAKLKLYGLVKASAIYDSSSPYGTDMPLPGFINGISGSGFDPGPTRSPEFHAKARFARVGTNFEWPDIGGSHTAFTGKIEFDFEGNYSRALNRNISTIRSNMASIRLAYGRVDHMFNDKTSAFLLFGQDWTPFGSSTLPALFETTGLGLGFGTLYERDPQVRFGLGHKIGGSRNLFFQPEFAVVMPGYGNDPTNVADQLGYGEKQGADSGRPEVQARVVFQWQLDKAPGVAPAQLIFSGVQGQRKVMVRSTDIPLCTNAALCSSDTVFRTAFPNGAETTSDRAGWTGEIQLPTRYVTAIAKYWDGSDLRFFFVGSLFSNYNDTAGMTKPCLTGTTAGFCSGPSNDGGSSLLFGLNGAGDPVFAPQRPVRTNGGFVNLGFPLGRIFHADPAGRNAGWQLYLHYAFDQAKSSDVTKLGNQRSKNDLAAATLSWKVNNLVQFVVEESLYRTRIVNPTDLAKAPLYEGVPAREWHDFRSEIGPIFTF